MGRKKNKEWQRIVTQVSTQATKDGVHHLYNASVRTIRSTTNLKKGKTTGLNLTVKIDVEEPTAMEMGWTLVTPREDLSSLSYKDLTVLGTEEVDVRKRLSIFGL
jgi:hypothetical protein